MFLTIIVFVAILSILVFAHELGHYFSAKFFGVKAKEFGFGYPPRICGWKTVDGKKKFFWGNKNIDEIESEKTVLSFNWLPLGGFVNLGEDEQKTENEDPNSFTRQKPFKRAIILSAGVLMNLVLAMVLLSIAFMLGAPQVVDSQEAYSSVVDPKIQIYQVEPDSPAQLAGLSIGDVIVKIDDQEIYQVSQIQEIISQKKGEPANLQVSSFGEMKNIEVQTTVVEDGEPSKIGVALVMTGKVSYPWYQSIWLGIKNTILMTGAIIFAFYELIKNLIVGAPSGVEVSGPVGIAVMSGQVARLGFVYLLQFAAILSINLAIINFLPIPALDGGRVLFIIVEKIRRKPISQKIEAIIHTTGFALLMLLVVVVTGKDIYKFRESFINIFQNIFG